MSIGRSVWVYCDGALGEECDEEFVLMGSEPTVEEARSAAKAAGWQFTGDLDLCPGHKQPVVSR